MNGVPPQQAGSFLQVIAAATLGNDRPQAPLVPTAAALNEDARQHAADTTKTVEDDVFWRLRKNVPGCLDIGQMGTYEALDIRAGMLVLKTAGELADVNA